MVSNNERYIDPLIADKNHNKFDAYDRERVAAEDPIANILTWDFHIRMWDELPKFYLTDEVDAPEIMQEWRQLFDMMKLKQPMIVMGAMMATHGWAAGQFFTDEQGQLKYKIFSEYQCKYQNIQRNAKDEPVMYIVNQRKHLPLNRTMLSMNTGVDYYYRQSPGFLHSTRGDPCDTFWYGWSRLEAVWDSITKLREESHANALRARVFPIAKVPNSWDDDQVKDFFKAISKMDQTTALAVRSAVDNEGNPVPELPDFGWISPGQSSNAKSTQGSGQGSGGSVELSSEWARLCSVTHHTIRYYVGNPGGALAAADVDAQADLDSDIEESHQYVDTIKDFMKILKEVFGVPYDLPPSFCIKFHWQWKRDELALQQAALADQQMQIEEQKAQPKQNSLPNFKPKKRGLCPSCKKPLTSILQHPTEGYYYCAICGAEVDYGANDLIRQNTEVFNHLLECYRANLNMPMSPVSSSTVKGVGLYGKKLLVEFHGKGAHTKYAYDIGSEEEAQSMWSDMMQSTSKGGYVWDHLKGKSIGPAWGTGKPTPGGTSASLQPYEPYTRNPVGFIGVADRKEFEQRATDLQQEKVAALGTDRYAYPEERGFPSGQPSEFYTEPQMFGGQVPTGQVDMGGIATEMSALQQPSQLGAPESTMPTLDIPTSTNVSGQVPPKSAYSASFVWGKTGTPQDYTQRPKGMKTKTEFTTQSTTPYSTMDPTTVYSMKAKKANSSLVDFNNTQFNELAQKLYGTTHSEHTIDKFKELLKYNEELQRQQILRTNSMQLFSGKPMDFNIDLYYDFGDGQITKERCCKKSWKKNVVGKKGKVQIYHKNMQYPVGDVEFGWDDQTDEPTMKALFDRAEVQKIMERENMTTTRLYQKLKNNEPLPVSTEYFADITIKDGIRYQTNIRDISLALVDQGNCPDNLCNLR